jgi:tetratricopeptide (TPR) repeat protein
MVATQWSGGFVKEWGYGLLWYYAVPAGLTGTVHVEAVLLFAMVAQVLFALALLGGLLFRPHPFLAAVLGYASALVLGYVLVAEPLLALMSPAFSPWQLIFASGSVQDKLLVAGAAIATGGVYALVLNAHGTRVWFSGLTRPLAADELNCALVEANANPGSPYLACRLGLVYLQMGFTGQARSVWRALETLFPNSVYGPYLLALLSWQERKYGKACQEFVTCAHDPTVGGALRAQLLAAAACSAFGANNYRTALHWSGQALELDNNMLLARMVKADALMATGNKEQAAGEILQAASASSEADFELVVPLDTALVLKKILQCQSRAGGKTASKEQAVQDSRA